MKRGAAACLAFIESYHKRQGLCLENNRKEANDLSKRNAIFKSENECLKQYIIEKKFHDQDAQIQQLRDENGELKAKVASLQEKEVELEKAQKEKAVLEKEIEKLRTSSDETEKNLKEQIGVLSEELGKYKTASETEIQLNDLLKERIRELEKSVKKQPPQNTSLAGITLPQFPANGNNGGKTSAKQTAKVITPVIPQMQQQQHQQQKQKPSILTSPQQKQKQSPKTKSPVKENKKCLNSKGASSSSSMFSALDFFTDNALI